MVPLVPDGLSCFLPCVPPKTTHQRKRIVRVGGFARLADAPALVGAKATLDALLLAHQPAAPVSGPVTLNVVFTWPWLASHGRKVREGRPIPHTSKPDLSNVIKTLEDRLVALRFLEDDRSVSTLLVSKWWGGRPGIALTITPVERSA